ncbi:unnamed protein product, partial [Rotaria sp. Silwood2]
MACPAPDRDKKHPEMDQRKASMLVRKVICHREQLNDDTDEEYQDMAETYPMTKSLPSNYMINWNDTS